MFEARADGIEKIYAALNHDSDAVIQYLMLEKGLYLDLAKANAEAIKGLEPQITVWNTANGESTDAGKPIRDIFQCLPPLLTTINQQTGISPPNWLAKMDKSNEPNTNQVAKK